MKICPVCKARCFDDMDICYGCLHRFTEGEGAENAKPVNVPASSAISPASVPPVAPAAPSAPAPSSSAVPASDEKWVIRLELPFWPSEQGSLPLAASITKEKVAR